MYYSRAICARAEKEKLSIVRVSNIAHFLFKRNFRKRRKNFSYNVKIFLTVLKMLEESKLNKKGKLKQDKVSIKE